MLTIVIKLLFIKCLYFNNYIEINNKKKLCTCKMKYTFYFVTSKKK